MKRHASSFAEPLRSAILDIPSDTEVVEIKVGDCPCFGSDNFEGAALQAHRYVHSDFTYDLCASNRRFPMGFESDLRDAAFGTL